MSLDIAEVFKPLIGDRLIFSLLNRNQITEDSFTEGTKFSSFEKDASKLIVSERKRILKKDCDAQEFGKAGFLSVFTSVGVL